MSNTGTSAAICTACGTREDDWHLCRRAGCHRRLAANMRTINHQELQQVSDCGAQSCGCMGPQNGQPHCPCVMRTLRVVDGRYVKDMGPVEPARPALNLWQNTRGCICPPGSEATCLGALCPRKPHGPAAGAM